MYCSKVCKYNNNRYNKCKNGFVYKVMRKYKIFCVYFVWFELVVGLLILIGIFGKKICVMLLIIIWLFFFNLLWIN